MRLWALSGPIILVMLGAGSARAQTDFTAGKSPAQLFATDCAACHRSPQGLARGRDPTSIAYFLRDHYTTKPASAGAIATYLWSVRGTAPPRAPTAAPGQGQAAAPGDPAAAGAPAARQRPLDRITTATVERLKAFASAADAAKPSDPNAPERGPARLGAYAAAGAAVDLVRQTAVAAAMRNGRAALPEDRTPSRSAAPAPPAGDETAKGAVSGATGALAGPAMPAASAAAGPGPAPELRGPPASSARPSAQSNDDPL